MVLTTSTFAALHIASVASTKPVKPLVSIRPRAVPNELLFCSDMIAPKCEISNLKFQISNRKLEISNLKFAYAFLLHRTSAGGSHFPFGKHATEIIMRPGDHMDADHRADSTGRFRS